MDSFCRKTPDKFILFDNVVLHVLILFTIVSGLFAFIITKLTIKHINGEFIHMIDEFVNPENIKELIINGLKFILKIMILRNIGLMLIGLVVIMIY